VLVTFLVYTLYAIDQSSLFKTTCLLLIHPEIGTPKYSKLLVIGGGNSKGKHQPVTYLRERGAEVFSLGIQKVEGFHEKIQS
jgi:hypothetical protein